MGEIFSIFFLLFVLTGSRHEWYIYFRQKNTNENEVKQISIFGAIWELTETWLASLISIAIGFLLLALARTIAGWWLDFKGWVKGLFKGGE